MSRASPCTEVLAAPSLVETGPFDRQGVTASGAEMEEERDAEYDEELEEICDKERERREQREHRMTGGSYPRLSEERRAHLHRIAELWSGVRRPSTEAERFYIGDGDEEQDGGRQQRRQDRGKGQGRSTTSRSKDSSESASAGGTYPWWPATEEAYITQPLGDEIGLLPDTGAHDNLCGDRWAQSLQERCEAAGAFYDQKALAQQRAVAGVGGQ